MDSGLTDRQRREQEFYEEYSAAHAELTTSFDPVEGPERRPRHGSSYPGPQLERLLRESTGTQQYQPGNPQTADHRDHGSFGVRQEHVAEDVQPIS